MFDAEIQAISKNVKKYRLLNKMTQEELASKLNMDTQYYAQIERCERKFTLEKIINVCRILNVNIQDIVDIPQVETKRDKETLNRVKVYLETATDNQLFLIDRFITEILPYIK